MTTVNATLNLEGNMCEDTEENKNDRFIEVRTGQGKLLFRWNAARHEVEIRLDGQVFEIPIWQIEAHVRTSQRNLFTAYEIDMEILPCGHTGGTVLNADYQRVCRECGR